MIIDDEVEPPYKKPHRGLPEDQVSSTGGNSKTNVDLEVSEPRKSSSGTRMGESSQSFSGNRGKDSIQVDEENSSPVVLYANDEPNDIALGPTRRETRRDQENGNAIVLRGEQPIDDHSPQFVMLTSNIRPGKQRAANAYNAMKRLGISQETVKPVLKRLWELYNKNWALIEEDNYRTLADAIFEDADDQLKKKKPVMNIDDEVEPQCKKPHGGLPEDQVSSTGGNSKSNVDLEVSEARKSSSGTRRAESSQSFSGNKGKDPIQVDEENSSSVVLYVNDEPNDITLGPMRRETRHDQESRNAIVLRGKQPTDHSPQFAMPTTTIRPGLTDTPQHSNASKKRKESSLAYNPQTMFQTKYDIASSTCGEVKLSLTCSQAQGQSNFHIPSSDEVLNFAENKYRKSCKTVGPQFSLVNLLNDLCESYLEMGSDLVEKPHINRTQIHRLLRSNEDSKKTDHPEGVLGKRVASNGNGSSVSRNEKKRVVHIVNDITNGTEKVKISLLDEIGGEELPSYIYSPENITYESAYVHVSLARISDMDCCSGCKGDCLSSSIPCVCASDTGGEFAYTLEGLLNERFLESCISMKSSPEKHHQLFCQDCPLERAKNAQYPEKCKGHMWRKFIKECWRKCGCSMLCGNRVVQRGITRKLQVFLTGEGKGWGIRTLEELPKGAFVCEYVGEILTNIELYERNKKSRGQDKHVYPVLLDADWGTEGVLKDEEALCLDATHYGNIARFINHRCFDGNLLEVPVQVETPDRHYYHLAFFTKRKVEALEELTWDYGIDFDDDSHPIKAFQCRCGSQFCRGRKGKS
ncbi:hypothetical protein BUALT_Bualt06G0012100 [Buddleja alternifolia]|uniref:Histone-lysine N-methyltransferase SUVR4 n=1 Tax=Buddleja alternifolia TaxID=168488 RepID=A0AAV6XJ36_9LAMI|nr:hypothetical protein BUALT_Bualt06G0012100 [Buddleja alternifolia]